MTRLLTKKEHERLKKRFLYRGAIKEAAEFTNLHRTTISRILETGKGDTNSVALLISFMLS